MALHFPIKELARVNVALALALVWSGLIVSAVAACVHDIGRWLNAW